MKKVLHNLKKNKWWKAAFIRAVKTMSQTALALIPMGVSIEQVGWLNVIGSSLLAGIISMLQSVAGLPEVD